MPNNPVHSIHDAFFRDLFSQIEHVRSFLESYLPFHVLKVMDLNQLERQSARFVKPQFQQIESDCYGLVKMGSSIR